MMAVETRERLPSALTEKSCADEDFHLPSAWEGERLRQTEPPLPSPA
jgi:hypothetical protein